MSNENHFSVGDLVIMQRATVFEEYEGFLAVVTDPGTVRQVFNSVTMGRENVFCYRTKVLTEPAEISGNITEFCVRPWQIRPLRDGDETDEVSEPNELEEVE